MPRLADPVRREARRSPSSVSHGGRRGRYKVERLIAKQCVDAMLRDLLATLADCPKAR